MLYSVGPISPAAVELYQTGLVSFITPVERPFQSIVDDRGSIAIEGTRRFGFTGGQGWTPPLGSFVVRFPILI